VEQQRQGSGRDQSASPIHRLRQSEPLKDEILLEDVRVAPRRPSPPTRQSIAAAPATSNEAPPPILHSPADLLVAYRNYRGPAPPPIAATVFQILQAACHYRYRLLFSTDYMSSLETLALRPDKKWLFCIVGFPKDQELPEALLQCLHDFVGLLLYGQKSPQLLWDLAGNISTWGRGQAMSIARVTLNWRSVQTEAYRLLEDKEESSIEDSCWLVVESALTVAYIWRLGCYKGIVEVAHRLLRDGIPFRWLYLRSTTYCIKLPPNRDNWHTSLG
jgi:hypothetical protein